MPPAKYARNDALREEIITVTNGLIVPPERDLPNAPTQRSGVFDQTGAFIPASHTYRPHGLFNDVPDMPADDTIQTLQGTWMFGGTFFGHFGHFLMDTLARIWAWGVLENKVDGILFTPKTNAGNIENMVRVQTDLLNALGVNAPLKVLQDPTRVQTLHVPYQGIGIGGGWETGTPSFRAYMRQHAGKSVTPKGPKKVYLSRSALAKKRASFLAEAVLEEHLRAAGYEIVHPQKLSKSEQVALYQAATHIISPDGSPMHLLAYAGRKDQHVAVIARRSAEANSIFANQISQFQGSHAITVNALKHDWVPSDLPRPGRTSWGEFDMTSVYEQLMAGGFLPEGTDPWPTVPDDVLEAELAEITAAEGKTYTRFEG